MKCLRCDLVNPSATNLCKRCQTPLFSDPDSFSKRKSGVYRDAGFLIVENKTALPKRCYRCNSRDIVAMKTQTLEYVPALSQALDFAVTALIPVPIPLDFKPGKKQIHLDLSFCRRHRTPHRTLFKIGLGNFFFGVLCFVAAFYFDNHANFFVYALMTGVAAFFVAMILLYIEKEKEIVSSHKYQAPYFWVKGFGDDYLRSFPSWTDSAPR